jgi:hypothetical protein
VLPLHAYLCGLIYILHSHLGSYTVKLYNIQRDFSRDEATMQQANSDLQVTHCSLYISLFCSFLNWCIYFPEEQVLKCSQFFNLTVRGVPHSYIRPGNIVFEYLFIKVFGGSWEVNGRRNTQYVMHLICLWL